MTVFDYTSTARRPGYRSLPREVRAVIVRTLGGEPDDVRPAGGGFTPGFAASVHRGSRAVFVKAAPSTEPFAYPAYSREADILRAMPDGPPVPRLLAADTAHVGPGGVRWVTLVIRHIDGVMPGGPWTVEQAGAVEAGLLALQGVLDDLPAEMVSGYCTDGLADDDDVLATFARAAADRRGIPFLPTLSQESLREADRLVRTARFLPRGSAVVHNDLRPDNLIIERGSGRAWVCDWNFLTRGPAWSDWVGLLPYLRNDGLPVEDLLRSSPLSSDADPEAVDAWLAVLAAYMVRSGLSPEVPHSPLLRNHARFTARIMVDWLSERRKWTA